MRATDADDPSTANGELRYSLIQDQSAFEIDSITGLCLGFFLVFFFFSGMLTESALTSETTPSLSV